MPAIFEKALARTKELTKEIDRLWSQRLPDLAASARVVDIDSTRVGVQIVEIPPGLVMKLAAMTAQAVGGVGIAVSGTRIAIGSQTVHAGELLKRIQNVVGGKGGGSPRAANGSLGTVVTSDALIEIVKEQ